MVTFKELNRKKIVAERLLKFLENECIKLEDENSMIKDTVDLGIFEFEKAMEVFRVHYDGLCVRFEMKEMDFKDLLFRKAVVEGQLKACMITINGLVQRISCLEKGRKVGFREEQGHGKAKVGGFVTEKNRDLVLGTQSGYWRKRVPELKEELKVYKSRCQELSVKLENKKMECVMIEGKYKEMMSRNVGLDEKLVKYKNICYGSEQRICHLEEERKAKCESDKRVQERIAYLEKELKTKEINEELKYAELIAVNRDLECRNRRAEEAVESWKKKFTELETKGLRLEEEISTLRSVESQACGGLQSEDSYNDNREKDNRNIKLQTETKIKTDGAHEDHMKIKEKMANNSEKILTLSFTRCNHPSSPQGNMDGQLTGPASVALQSKPVVNFKGEKNIAPLESKVEFQTRVRQGSVTPTSSRLVSISVNEDEKELTPNHTFGVRGKETVQVSTYNTLKRSSCSEQDLESQKSLKRLCSDQGGEKCGVSYDEDIARSSNPKRRASVVVTSESENEDDNSDSEDSSSGSEDESEIHLAFAQAIAKIKRNRLMESNWQSEADMLSSFEVDSELCMKAVCALYRQQIPKEELMMGSLDSNNKGFNKYDALRCATFAEFLTDGYKEGDLQKSAKELELFDPKALEECKRLANYYSKQLFTLYQSKEDPFFHPL